VDLLLFNPPYVPTETEEVGGMDLSAAWAGGINGREVLDKLLPQLPVRSPFEITQIRSHDYSFKTLLSGKGCVYLVVLEENKPKELAAQMASYGFSAEVAYYPMCSSLHLTHYTLQLILQRRSFNELLSIIKYRRNNRI